MTPEDIGDIFQELEDNLFALAIRNIKRHENWEEAEGFKWTQWQAEQIAGLREYRKNVQVLTDYHFDKAKDAIKEYLKEAYDESVDDAENTARRLLGRFGLNGQMSQNFFGVNSNKLDIIINEAVQNVDTKRYAAINRMNSGYTDFLRRADMFAQSGSYTIPQAVDMASKDFLAAGLNCVEYSNGNRVNIASYTEMALRTSSAEVTRQANGDVRDEFGEYLVVSNVIGMTCPYCQKWQGRVMIDDVYSSGQPDGKHLTVSEAKADHFLHPNCRHQLYMYIPGVTKVADLPNDVETKEHYRAEQKQRYYEREIRKYKRLRDGAVDPENRRSYDARVKEWTAKHDQHLKEHEYLRRNPKRLAPGYVGNGKPSVFRMSTSINTPLSIKELTNGKALSAEDKTRLLDFANKHRINIHGINKFDGDPEILMDQLQAISEYKEMFPRVFSGKRVTVSFSDIIEDGTFAETNDYKTITFNKYYLRDRKLTELEMRHGNQFSSTHVAGIAKHELGHVIENVHGNKGLQFARETYYNIFKKEVSDSDLQQFLNDTVSYYCAPDKFNDKGCICTDWNEITSEVMATEKDTEFSRKFMMLWRKEGLR